MPIQNFSSFKSMTTFCRTKVPPHVWDEITPIQGDDEAVKAYGIRLCTNMCKTLMEAGVRGFHFYTLNLENSVMSVLRELDIDEGDASKRYSLLFSVKYPGTETLTCCTLLFQITTMERFKSELKEWPDRRREADQLGESSQVLCRENQRMG